MLKRTFDGRELTQIANLGAVRPRLGGSGSIDLIPMAADPNNFVMVTEGGGFLALPVAPGVYEVHTVMYPKCNARRVARAGIELVDYLFTATPAERLWTKWPEDNDGAGWLAAQAGFEDLFVRQNAWAGGLSVTYAELLVDKWVHACSTHIERGREFHRALEASKKAAGSPLPDHPEDESHDRAVGAAIAMMLAGNAIKAANLYNRWALFAGYAPVSVVSLQPTVIDIRDALVGLTDGRVEILQCR
jgi:hypothetical protein